MSFCPFIGLSLWPLEGWPGYGWVELVQLGAIYDIKTIFPPPITDYFVWAYRFTNGNPMSNGKGATLYNSSIVTTNATNSDLSVYN